MQSQLTSLPDGYSTGFASACAQAGVDPAALLKLAQLPPPAKNVLPPAQEPPKQDTAAAVKPPPPVKKPLASSRRMPHRRQGLAYAKR